MTSTAYLIWSLKQLADRLERQPNAAGKLWGRHLLEDWRTLVLWAETHADPGPDGSVLETETAPLRTAEG